MSHFGAAKEGRKLSFFAEKVILLGDEQLVPVDRNQNDKTLKQVIYDFQKKILFYNQPLG